MNSTAGAGGNKDKRQLAPRDIMLSCVTQPAETLHRLTYGAYIDHASSLLQDMNVSDTTPIRCPQVFIVALRQPQSGFPLQVVHSGDHRQPFIYQAASVLDQAV